MLLSECKRIRLLVASVLLVFACLLIRADAIAQDAKAIAVTVPTVDNIPPDPSIPQPKSVAPTDNIPVVNISTSSPAVMSQSQSDTEGVASKPDGNIETTLFDIYLGDTFKGSVLVDYTDNWLKVGEPEAVIEQLKNVKGGEKLLPLLKDKIYKRKEIEKVAAVHYDLNTFRLIIDVTPEFLGVSPIDLSRRISPDPDAGFSLLQRLGVAASGDISNNPKSAFSHRSVATVGEYYAIGDGAIIDGQAYQLNEASAGGIVGDYRVGGGLLQTAGTTFSPSLQITGVNVQTAEELFLDQDLIRGSQLQVFVPSRSKVEFYRNGQLLSVQVLDFGLQEVNTSNFPQGSYDVDIIITDSFGLVTRERRFYTKAGFLTSRSQPIFSLQAGKVRDNLSPVDLSVYQAGIRWRASSIFDLDSSVYGSDKLTIGTLQTNGLYRQLRFGFGGSMSNHNDAGVIGSLGLNVLDTNFDVNSIKTTHGGTQPPVVPTPDPNDPFSQTFSLKNPQRELTFQDRTQLNYSVSHQFGPVDTRYVTSKSSGGGSPVQKSSGPTIDWLVIDRPGSSLHLQGSHLTTDQGKYRTYGLSYLYRLSDHLNITSQVAHRIQDTSTDNVFFLTLNYDDKTRDGLGNRLMVNDDIQSKNKTIGGTETSYTNQVELNHTGEYLESVGFLRDSRTHSSAGSGGNTNIGGSAESSFLISPDGGFSISHPIKDQGVFIAEVSSQSLHSEFELLLDNQKVADVVSGNKVVVGVTPYRTYQVRIRPKQGAELADYDSSSTTITVFPGNVSKRTWQVEKVFIVLGKIVDEQGNPVARQRVRGTRDYTATEDDGTFQAEIGQNTNLSIASPSYQCDLHLKLPEHPDYFVDLGNVICTHKND